VRLPGSSVTDIPIPDDMLPTNTTSPQLGYSMLTPFLKKQDRTIDRVLGDGNCLSRALSRQLTGVQDYHIQLRGIIAQCESKIALFQELHAAINETEFTEHLKNIRRNCTWGINLEIIVTATLFGLDVYVAMDSYRPGKSTWLKYSPNTLAVAELHHSSIKDLSSSFPILSHKKSQWLELAHVSRCHFDVIKPIGKGDPCRPILETFNSTDEVVELID